MWNKIIGISGALLLLAGTVEAAPVILLPRTGQSDCYDSFGNKLQSCQSTWQDGDSGAGVFWPSPRFFDNQDGSIADYLTGLAWIRDANSPGTAACPDSGKKMTWGEALAHVSCLNGLSYLGKNDWRLPNINELRTLFDSGQANNAAWLGSTATGNPGFHNVQAGFYHSSTSGPLQYGARTDYGVNLSSGVEAHSYSYPGSVWPVRTLGVATIGNARPAQTGQQNCYDPVISTQISCSNTGQDAEKKSGVPQPGVRFVVSGQTLLDNLTGLQWSKDGKNQTFAACGTVAMSWQSSLAAINCLNRAMYQGFSDWRMPNLIELFSLFNPAVEDNAAWLNDSGFDLNANSSGYWSSTTSLANASNAKLVNYSLLGLFAQTDEPKNYTNYLLPVRTSQILTEPQIALVPQNFNFGEVLDSDPLSQSFIVKNTSNSSKTLTVATSPLLGAAQVFSKADTCQGRTLSAGEECVISIYFPAVKNIYGNSTAYWTVATNDPQNPSIKVTVLGSSVKADITPDPFSFAPMNNVQPSTLIVSAPVKISGITGSAPITVSNGELSLDNGATWKKATDTGLTVKNGTQIIVRHTSAAQYASPMVTTVFINGIGATFTSTTGIGPGTSAVRIGGNPYGNLISAYSQASAGAVIQALGITFSENLDLRLAIAVTIAGGYESTFISRPGYTTINGTVTIGAGSLVADRLVL